MERRVRSVREDRFRYRAAPGACGPPAVAERLYARARAIAWAGRVAADSATVYLDTETTGLGRDAEVIELAVVGADGGILLDTLVRPVGPIPADASRIHGILDAHVADAPDWRAVHERLCGLLEGRTVVVYNARFDRRMVAQCCGRHRLVDPYPDWQCAMIAYAGFRAEPKAAGRGHRWHKLEHAVAAFGAAAGGHRAAADALACRAVVLGMAVAPLDE